MYSCALATSLTLMFSLDVSAAQTDFSVFAYDGVVIGGYVGNTWKSGDEICQIKGTDGALLTNENTEWTSYTIAGESTQVNGISMVFSDAPSDMCELYKNGEHFSGGFLTAGNVKRNLMPNKVAAADPENQEIFDNLKRDLQTLSNSTKKSKPMVVQAFEGDLDGDGEIERVVLGSNLAATREPWMGDGVMAYFDPACSESRCYSLLQLLRKNADKGWSGPELIFMRPGNDYAMMEGGVPTTVKVVQFVDLDGDGSMEIIVCVGYYESTWFRVYSSKTGKELENLSFGYGA